MSNAQGDGAGTNGDQRCAQQEGRMGPWVGRDRVDDHDTKNNYTLEELLCHNARVAETWLALNNVWTNASRLAKADKNIVPKNIATRSSNATASPWE